jgi:surfeit locus 1 family protein
MTVRSAVILVLALSVTALTARLGWWQLDRADQKQRMQQALDTRAAMPPLPPSELAQRAGDIAAQAHRTTTLRGRWLNDLSIYLDNRPMAGRIGFYLVTPLAMDDGTTVLVQRGWVPRDLMDRSRVPPPPPQIPTEGVRGRLAPALARLYEFDATAKGLIRQNLELSAYAAETGLNLRPWVLVQLEDSETMRASGVSNDDLKRQWPAPDTGLQKHHGYAFQWFSLSVLTLTLYGWFQVIRPRRRVVT